MSAQRVAQLTQSAIQIATDRDASTIEQDFARGIQSAPSIREGGKLRSLCAQSLVTQLYNEVVVIVAWRDLKQSDLLQLSIQRDVGRFVHAG